MAGLTEIRIKFHLIRTNERMLKIHLIIISTSNWMFCP